MINCLVCLISLALLTPISFAKADENKPNEKLGLGILEYSTRPSTDNQKQIETRSVRAVFYKKDGKWTTGDFTKNATTWKVTFDGKVIGEVTTDDTNTSGYKSAQGLQTITSPIASIPSVGKLTDEFATWSDGKVFRPLILTTGKFNSDPDKWKRTKLSSAAEKQIKQEFRARFNEVTNCKSVDDLKSEQWKYTNKDIKILKTYESKTKWTAVSLRLGPHKCDGPPEEAFAEVWYSISPLGKISYLDSGMTLIDAGDYDGDEKSELIFQVSRYNKGGYIMYFNEFKENVDFIYGYH